MDCIFCKIANGELPATILHEDDKVCVFRDLAPQAPVHLVLIPKQHISSAWEISAENSALVGYLFEIAGKVARDLDLRNGFRIINNCGVDGGQTVGHLHFHLLGGGLLTTTLG